MGAQNLIGEHPVDVLSQITAWQRAGDACALIIVTKIEGGGVRARGALMAVSENRSIGYLSGGCIDADAVFQAHEALQDGSPRALRYGAGSPFVDLPLPCGGAIEVLIIPNPDITVMRDAASALQSRRAIDGVILVRVMRCVSIHFASRVEVMSSGWGMCSEAPAACVEKISRWSGSWARPLIILTRSSGVSGRFSKNQGVK